MNENETLISEQEIAEIQQELIEVAKERRQQKQQQEQQRQFDEGWNTQVKDFMESYPDIDLAKLDTDKGFIEHCRNNKGNIKSLYEGYLELQGKDTSASHKKISLTDQQKKLADKAGMSHSEYAKNYEVMDERFESPKAPTKLTPRQIKLCKSCGISPEEFLQSLKELEV